MMMLYVRIPHDLRERGIQSLGRNEMNLARKFVHTYLSSKLQVKELSIIYE